MSFALPVRFVPQAAATVFGVGGSTRGFATLLAAKSAAQTGDTIVVAAGTYNERNLLKDGVHWHFMAGAIVLFADTIADGNLCGIFDDSATGANGRVLCRITGQGQFYWSGSDSLAHPFAADLKAVNISNALSSVMIEAAIVNCLPTDNNGGRTPYAVFNSGGALLIETDRLASSTQGITAQCSGGTLTLKANVCGAIGLSSGTVYGRVPLAGNISLTGGTAYLDILKFNTLTIDGAATGHLRFEQAKNVIVSAGYTGTFTLRDGKVTSTVAGLYPIDLQQTSTNAALTVANLTLDNASASYSISAANANTPLTVVAALTASKPLHANLTVTYLSADQTLAGIVALGSGFFNVASKLVRLDGSARLPALDGSLLTGLTKSQVGLGSVENTALSTWAGTANITALGAITTGSWTATRIAEAYGGTNQTSYTLGDVLYASAANTLSKLAGNTAGTKKFFTQTGTGTVSAAPGWGTIAATDVSGLATSATTDTTSAANISSGTLNKSRMDATVWPTRATIWPDELTVVSGAAQLADAGARANLLYAAEYYQNTPANNDKLSCSVALAAGTYSLYILGRANATGAAMTVLVDGVSAGTFSWYAASTSYNKICGSANTPLSITIPTSGYHKIELLANDDAASAGSQYYNIIQKIWLKQATD